MKRLAIVLVILGVFMAGSTAFAADANDLKWIARCLLDNTDADASTEVVIKYCTCMTAKMDKGETLSVTQWEKKHPNERKECDRISGWK